MFVTGIIVDKERVRFSWVYDCGSKRQKAMAAALHDIANWNLWPDPVGMVVLSHFDDDHVNGLEALLKKRRVNCLVLPYSEWQHRVREVAIGGLKGSSPSTAQMQLDPVGWLESRELITRVERLLLIRGGQDREPLSPDRPDSRPISESEDFTGPSEQLDRDLRMNGNAKPAPLEVLMWQHHYPVVVPSLPMEYMFYNAELSGTTLGIIDKVGGKLVAKKSGLSLSKVRQDVETTIAGLGLVYPFTSLQKNWRSTLKGCYQKHFGSTSKARNNISLCLLVRPLSVNGTVAPCSIFYRSAEGRNFNIGTDSVFDRDLPGVLCTGDLTMNKHVILAMESHFGTHRWKQTGLLQVPHHGSTHSWAAGNAALLVPTTFVNCAPGSKAHPHPTVVSDLQGHPVCMADYTTSVVLNYHFSA